MSEAADETDPRPGASGLLPVESTVEAPEVVVVGDPHTRTHVLETLSSLAVALYSAGDLDEAKRRIGPATVAVVLVLPLPEGEPRRTLAALRDAGGRGPLPVFVVVGPDYPGYGARRLYDEGAAAVFEWPGEAVLLPRVVREILGVETEPGHPGEADRTLAEAVAARLHVADGIGESITAEVHNGVARVRGQVGSLWQKQRVRGLLEHVPGIVGVVDRELEVRPPSREDEDLEKHVRDLVACVPGLDPAAVSVSVREGKVDLTGNVASRGRLARLVDMIVNIEGVRQVQNRVGVARQGAKRSANLARALEGGVRALHPDADVHVSVFGSVAVLTGDVPVLALRTEIERQMRRRDEIDRIVNKIHVREPAPVGMGGPGEPARAHHSQDETGAEPRVLGDEPRAEPRAFGDESRAVVREELREEPRQEPRDAGPSPRQERARMDTIAAMFNDQPSAAAAIDGLVGAGFSTDRISMLVAESDRGHHFKVEAGNKAAQGAIGGSVAGGAIGALVAGLAATGLILIPGLGLLGVGPILAALAGLGAGATAGGTLGALVGMGIPEHQAKVMHDQLVRGGVLVAIEVHSPEERHTVERILHDHRASSISRAAA